MTTLTDVSYKPVLFDDSTVPLERSLASDSESFDEALEQIATASVRRTLKSARAAAALSGQSAESRSSSKPSALFDTAAIAATAYRVSLSPPDDPKLRSLWYSRFPTI